MKEDFIKNFNYDNDIPIKWEIILRVLRKRFENNSKINDNKDIKKKRVLWNRKKKDKKKRDNIDSNIKKDNKFKNKLGKRIVVIGLFILFLVIFIASMFEIVNWYRDNKETSKNIEEIEDIVQVEEIVEEKAKEMIELVNVPAEATSDYWYYIKFPLIQVDFNELVKKNNDTIAWIQVNNTNINYPVVQASDNDYYLNHSYDKKWNDAGWVFVDYRNTGTFTDRNTIIYAHSRKDRTMFGSLKNTLKSDWYNNRDNHIINISTPTENSLWQIFSVYTIKSEIYYITTDFEDDDSYLEFLNTLRSRSRYNFDVCLSESDSIITLSTCYTEGYRMVVHAKKIKKSARES